MEEVIKGKNREKLVIGKLDPPAAFNLEDIQNFPEDRLQPLLNAPGSRPSKSTKSSWETLSPPASARILRARLLFTQACCRTSQR